MADTDAAPAAPAPKVKTPKKKVAKAKKPSNHPKYSDMIKAAVTSLKERGGSSRQAILKYILANYNVGKDSKTVNSHLKLALRAGVKNGKLKQSKGTGASGSFRLGDAKAEKKPKAKKAVKKPAAAAVKKAKSPKKVKAKKPKAAGEKKAKSPKKAKKPKAAAAKKSPAKAKKAAKPKAAKKAKTPKKKAAAKKK